MVPETRRLVQLTLDAGRKTDETMDMLLAKKRSSERRTWLEKKGDQASIAFSLISSKRPPYLNR